MTEDILIRRLQMIRTAFLDGLFKTVTVLGDEMFFIVIAVIAYWCINKRWGYKLINVYLLGCCVVEGIKAIVARPRPYNYYGVESVGEKTSGYSFPSGHSHSIANLSTQVTMRYQRIYAFIIGGILMVLVAFSRMYLGQHFLSDVMVGLVLGVALAMLLSMAFELLKDKEELAVLGIVPVCLIVLLVLVIAGKTGSASGVLKVLGGYSAVSIGYYIEKKYVKSTVDNKWYFQILKVVFGLAVTLAFLIDIQVDPVLRLTLEHNELDLVVGHTAGQSTAGVGLLNAAGQRTLCTNGQTVAGS